MPVDTRGVTFLYNFALGNYNMNNPGVNVISVTSTASGDFDKKNLTSSPLREVWRSVNATGWQEIIMQADQLVDTPDVFAVLNHNLTNLAVIQLQGSNDPSFVAPAFTVSIPWRKKHAYLIQDVGMAYDYYRFRILDPTNPCEYIQIGRIVAGKSFYFTDNEDIVDDITVTKVDKAYKTETEGFFRAFNERVKIDTAMVSFRKLRTKETDNPNFGRLEEMMDEVGETYPFLTILDPTDPTFPVIWGVIDRLPSIGYTINRYGSLSLTLQEVF